MSLVIPSIISFLFVLALFTLAYSIARIRNNIGIIDVFWGIGFLVVTWYTLLVGGPIWDRNVIIATLVSVWALRLTWHLSTRVFSSQEDKRYTKMRQGWKNVWLEAYTRVYVLQAVLVIILCAPILWVNLRYAPEITVLDLLGVAVWCVGFFFEVVGDAQLAQQKKTKNKELLTTGLWKYTRHPNYFGEIVIWWGIWIISLGSGAVYTIIAPILLTILIRYVSIPLTESHLAKKKGWNMYAQKTNMLLPRKAK